MPETHNTCLDILWLISPCLCHDILLWLASCHDTVEESLINGEFAEYLSYYLLVGWGILARYLKGKKSFLLGSRLTVEIFPD